VVQEARRQPEREQALVTEARQAADYSEESSRSPLTQALLLQ
jgi:hypothetical protein